MDLDFEDLVDTEKYDLENLGWFNHDFDDNKKSISFKAAFQKWKKEQSTEVLLVSFPKSKSSEIIEQLKLIKDLKFN